MIILYHNKNVVVEYENTLTNKVIKCNETNIQKCLYSISKEYKNILVVWCNYSLKDFINKEYLSVIFHHQLILASYSVSGEYIISKDIGIVDQHCFINVKRDIRYPTWLMSSDIGGINSDVLRKTQEVVNVKQSFDEFLCSLAKLNMGKGLICYSEPSLLKEVPENIFLTTNVNNSILFKFVKKHYKIEWVFILLLNQLIYIKRFSLLAFIKCLFYLKNHQNKIDFDEIDIQSTKNEIKKEAFKIDVLIPTLGRKEHLYNVLKDLSKQTLLPTKIIIVEQNALEGSISELDYLKDSWPFEIDHTFTHQLGACNARNIALSKVTGNWVFFADDDIRFESDLLKKSFYKINKFATDAIVLSCLLKEEVVKSKTVIQCSHFGSGTSLVKSNVLANVTFKKEHEFGYGEDSDFGMQLRNKGVEVLSTPDIFMDHLKAPIGGFRFKMIQKWTKEKIQPKPSPTVMAYNLKHLTLEQLKGYKIILFIKFYKIQSIKNPLSYLISFKKRWNISITWANKLMKDEL